MLLTNLQCWVIADFRFAIVGPSPLNLFSVVIAGARVVVAVLIAIAFNVYLSKIPFVYAENYNFYVNNKLLVFSLCSFSILLIFSNIFLGYSPGAQA